MLDFLKKIPAPIWIFLGIVVIAIIIGVLFGWAAPLSINNKSDVIAVEQVLNTDSTNVKIISISDIEELNGQDVQTINYETIGDSLKIKRVAIIDVKKHFLKYKVEGIHK